ncbi:MAG: hypothetical protein ACYTEQ_29370 [Planctomycetota bacterium]|jgi:hypothetical protein
MNRWQKIAWYNVVVIVVTLALTGVVVGLLAFVVGMPLAYVGLGLLGFLGLLGLSPILFRAKPGEVPFDERDRLIGRRAAVAGFGSAFLVVGLACMMPFFILGPRASISVVWLPLIFGGAGISQWLAHSVVILAQYGWRDKENE